MKGSRLIEDKVVHVLSKPLEGAHWYCTHDGQFHADEVMATAMLLLTRESVSVVRTRDPSLIAACPGYVYDVGGEYDPARGRLDHHQRGGAVTLPNGVQRSSAGLMWEVLRPQYEDGVWSRVDRRIVQAIDAPDNGQALVAGGTPAFEGVSSLSFSWAISLMNPREDRDEDLMNEAFARAVEFAYAVLKGAVDEAKLWSEMGDVVRRADAAARERGQPEVLVLEKPGPWHDHVDELPHVLYVVFPTEKLWMLQCVPPAIGSFGQRKPLPEAWAGLRTDELKAVTGVADAEFAHRGRFLAGAHSLAGALHLAALALAE